VRLWPGLDNDIDNIILSCKTCQDVLPSNHREPITHKPRPSQPFQAIAADFCSFAGREYLITVDCYTDWPDIIPMSNNTTAKQVLSVLKASFCRTGIPDQIWTDEGLRFMSKSFQEFAHQWDFDHSTSSPRYPRSNGKAEATVKLMKKTIRAAWSGRQLDEDKFTRALLQYRNTPSHKDGQSPAQKLFGHPIQDTLPAHRRVFKPEWQLESLEAEKRALSTREAVELSYNRHVRIRPEITIGSRVALQNNETKHWDIYGTVAEIGPHRRYFVKTQSGRVLVRN
jgi:transposase InsO family protein